MQTSAGWFDHLQAAAYLFAGNNGVLNDIIHSAGHFPVHILANLEILDFTRKSGAVL